MDHSRLAELKRSWRRRVDTPLLRRAASVGLRASMAMAAGLQRVADLPSRPARRALPSGQVTAVVKTFERPRSVRRLVRSVHRIHPDLHVIVVDDSRSPVDLARFAGAEVIVMPFNSGVSAGRNAGLARVDTPYVLILDDDFVFYRHTHLAGALALMDEHSDIDVMGGRVVNLPDMSSGSYVDAPLFPGAAPARHPVGSEIGGLTVYEKVPNFLLARTERLRLVGWNDELKFLDHRDFFTRASGVLTTVFNPSWRVLHARNPFDRASPARIANERAAEEWLWRRYFDAPADGEV